MDMRTRIYTKGGISFGVIAIVLFVGLSFVPALYPITSYNPSGYNLPAPFYFGGTLAAVLLILSVGMLTRAYFRRRDAGAKTKLVRYESDQNEFDPSR